jgi:hypothetical protein
MRPLVEETDKGILITEQSRKRHKRSANQAEDGAVLIAWKEVERVLWEIGRLRGKRFLQELQGMIEPRR